MKQIQTYNRVRTLESTRFRSFLSIVCIALFVIAFGSIASLSFWDQAPLYSLGTGSGALLTFSIIYILDSRNEKKCQFCRDTLSYTTRPFMLNNHFLSIRGSLRGEHFYCRHAWGFIPFLKRWVKISNRSLVCHHCRLTEEESHLYFEPVSESEILDPH